MQIRLDSDSHELPCQRTGTLAELARPRGAGPAAGATPEPSFLHRRPRQGRTSPAVAHVALHFASRIPLEHAATLCQLGSTQFCRLFKIEHRMSFGRFLLRFRLERAYERLTCSDALVKEVAYAVGFNDLSYFSRAFKREFGVCPSTFRAGGRSS